MCRSVLGVAIAVFAVEAAVNRPPRDECLPAYTVETAKTWKALNQTQLNWQMNNNCVDFGPMSEVISEDVGTNQVVHLLLTRTVRGAVMPVNKYGVQCSAKKLASEPCACFGGSARIAGVFEYIRSAYNATDTAADLTAAIDVGGNFFGSGLYYPWDKGETSAAMMKRVNYDVGGTMYLDWVTQMPTDGLISHFQSTATPMVSTNMELALDDRLATVVSKSHVLTTADGNTRVAVLSLMDPEFIAASNPTVAAKTLTDYKQAIDVELAALRRPRGGQERPAIVIAMIWGIPTTAAEELAAGSIGAAKLQAVDALIERTIGIDVYILSSIGSERDASYTTQNWAGDDVLVVGLTSSHDQGKAVEVVQATFNDQGLLIKTLSGSHAVALTCAVPESAAARATVDETESRRETAMRVPVATLQDAVDGSEIHGEGLAEDASFNITGDQFCAILIDDAGVKVGKCGCRVSQCQAGSLVADAMQRVTGADFAVVNGGGIRKSLPKGVITQENVHAMLPYLDTVVVLENVLGSTVREMLAHSISQLPAPDVTTHPHGRYLQVSKGLQFEWYFEGNQILLGAINICRQGSVDKMIGAACGSSTDFEPLDDAGTYTIATPGFIANGGDSYGMLTKESKVLVHKTQYEVVVEFLTEFNGGIPSMVSDVLQLHGAAPLTSKCADAGGASTRVCQTHDVVQIPIGLYCRGSEASSLQECDQAHHMVSVINNKHDGFMDTLLPHARLVLHENHIYTGCSKGLSPDASIRMNAEAAALTGLQGEKFVAVIGPGCSNDVQDITGKQWRDETGNQNLVISGSSTSSTLSDDAAYPNLARMSTSEVGVGAGFASLAKKYNWRRIAIVHDSSTWGTDAAKQFEARMLADSSHENELIYLNFAGTIDRSQCSDYTDKDFFGTSPNYAAKIINAKAGCDPITSFSVGKVRAGYPKGDADVCNPSDPSHFCVTEVIKQLKERDAKIIFIAAQRDTQRALFREIYKKRDIDHMDIYGEGYAYMSALVDQDLFVDTDGNVDTEALKGAIGTLGIREAVDKEGDTFKTYTTLWGEASSREACCQQGSKAVAGILPVACKRATPVNVTVLGKEHNFCDTDGDGTTGAGYAFSIADGVLSLARALQHNKLYRNAPKDSSKLYADLLAYHTESTDDQVRGITGTIRYEPDSGDRNGDLQIVNLQKITVGGGRHRDRRVVELEKSFAEFTTVGFLRVQQGSPERVLVNLTDCQGNACSIGTVFPGGFASVPLDTIPGVTSQAIGPKLTGTQKSTIASGVVAGLAVLAAIIVLAKRQVNARSVQKQIYRLKQLVTSEGVCDAKLLEGSLFAAIDFGIFDLIKPLLARGADAHMRDGDMQLPITRLLRVATVADGEPNGRSAHDGVEQPFVLEAVQELLSKNFEFEMHLGITIEQSPNVRALVSAAVGKLASSGWRSFDGNGDTVAHRLLTACRERRLSEAVTVGLMEAALEADASILTVHNAAHQTATDLAILCEGKREIQLRFTVVLFGRYQIPAPHDPIYKSSTAQVHKCFDLNVTCPADDGEKARRPTRAYDTSTATEGEKTVVLKVMSNPDLWMRELQTRDSLGVGGADANSFVGAISAALVDSGSSDALASENARLAQQYAASAPTPTIMFPPSLLTNTRRVEAREMMTHYSYAIEMECADRNLFEIIVCEQLAEEPLGLLRQSSRKVLDLIQVLHNAGVVHGDVKPKNLVRVTRKIRLIDLDMAFVVASGVLPAHADPEKFDGSTAYAAPEIHKWMARTSAGSKTETESPLDMLETPHQVDLWSFGVTLYEMVTGLPLFQNTYDRVTPEAQAVLQNWHGLDDTKLQLVARQHGKLESSSLCDLLAWMLAPTAADRPQRVEDVLKHSFFDPRRGSMRPDFAVDQIKALLASPGPERLDLNIMISYCWANTDFVLTRLAMALALRVREIWLDRLGGDNGMGEFAQASMQRGVRNADIVIAVVSPAYIESKNCGYEMELSKSMGKVVLPIVLNVPFAEWPPHRIGQSQMEDQFATADGDLKIFVDMTDPSTFFQKFERELVPRLAVPEGKGGSDSDGEGEVTQQLSRSHSAPVDAGWDVPVVTPSGRARASSMAKKNSTGWLLRKAASTSMATVASTGSTDNVALPKVQPLEPDTRSPAANSFQPNRSFQLLEGEMQNETFL